jgi:glutamine amidotransferase
MIAVIDYDAGNAPSVIAALDYLGEKAELVASASRLQDASAIILPGVGSAGATMTSLGQLGLIEPLLARMKAGTPFLGICVGLQILFEHSEEEDARCLGWFPGKVRRFSNDLRVPQIGWNSVTRTRQHPLLEGLEDENYFYFVNSYYAPVSHELVLGQATYGVPFAAMVSRDNVHATQFHAEKSGPLGLKILRNFVAQSKK